MGASDFSSMQVGTTQTLADISNLQNIQTQLYANLQQLQLQPTSAANTSAKNALLAQIRQVQAMETNLYANLNNNYQFFQTNLTSALDTLSEQKIANNIVQTELTNSQSQLDALKTDTANKQRLIEINTYYSDKYDAYGGLMRTVVWICLPIFILTLLANRGLLSTNISRLFTLIIMVIGVIYLWYQFVYTMGRDNMNFNEYNWNFNSSTAPTIGAKSGVNPWAIDGLGTCIGQACCDAASLYDSSVNMCVVQGE